MNTRITRCNKSEQGILYCLKNTKNVYCLSEFIQNISEKEIESIFSYIPVLLKHRSWIIRADTLDMIGRGKLHQFEKSVLNILENDKNPHVKSYALMAYYDLEGKKAIRILEQYSNSRSIYVKKTSLSLLYVATRRKCVLEELEKIVTRKDIVPNGYYSIYNTLCYYMKLEKHLELLKLFEAIIRNFKYAWQKDKDLIELIKWIKEANKKAKA